MKYSKLNRTKSESFLKRTMIASTIFCISIVSISLFSETANAGLFSYMSSLFESATASADMNIQQNFTPTSQTIAILQPAVNIDPNPNKASGLPPIENNALVSDLAMSSFDDSQDIINTQISTYIVRNGDTISGIAKMFDVSVNTIMWANNISRAKGLQVGQNLIILPVTGIKYTVKKGDSIKKIVAYYKADLNEVLNYNDMSLDTALSVGQTIIIPDAEMVISTPTKIVYGNNPAHDTNGPNYANYYIRPIDGGYRSQGLHGYNGVDLAGVPIGTPIHAAAAGKVIASMPSGYNGGYGQYVIISHPNGTQTLYGHMSRNSVSVGQYVEQGQKIGEVGNTGKSTGKHLHFEIRGAKNPF